MQGDIKSLKRWIDANPEYLLVLVSDHGVDEYGIAGYRWVLKKILNVVKNAWRGCRWKWAFYNVI